MRPEPGQNSDVVDFSELCAAILQAGVGGAFWEPAVEPPAGRTRLAVLPAEPAAAKAIWRALQASLPAASLALIVPRDAHGLAGLAEAARQAGTAVLSLGDPHAALAGAQAIYVAPGSPPDLAALGLLAGLPAFCLTSGEFAPLSADDVHHWLSAGTAYTDPFTLRPASCLETVALLADWRRILLRNREIAVCAGMSLWKRRRVAQLLAADTAPPFRRRSDAVLRAARARNGAVAVWSTRIPKGLEAKAAAQNIPLYRVEDGFIRSMGLGSDLLPPASIIVDRRGIYFDPSRPSDLEHLLSTAEFSDALRARARALVELLVARGVSKYGAGAAPARLPARPGQRVILVPGQVADDLSVRLGAAAIRSNGELLAAVRRAHPDAHIIYRPHPDVEAGHRPGAIPDPVAGGLADELAPGGAISALIGAVDEVHTLTSLAGFEALLRGRHVETYGQPFYAGWGLTRDHAPPPRRQRRLTLEELVAATLILYPLYVDPATGLPCGPELLIARLEQAEYWRPSLLMRARRLQGRLRRRLQALKPGPAPLPRMQADGG